MKKLQLSYAGHVSDRIQDLYCGTVAPEGIDLYFIPLQPFEAFNRMLHGDFHCAEMSFSTYVIRIAQGKLPFVAIPVFPARTFRHGAIYVNRHAGIFKPEHLAGRCVGVPEYQMTAAVWARGMLQHEYSVKPADMKWVTGGLREAGRKPMIDLDFDGIDIRYEQHKTLNDMLLSGEIDALIAPQVPPALLAGHPDLDYLFPDYPEVERAYFRKTAIFPIMHVVVIQREIYEQHPWAAVSLYRAFEQAKRNCMNNLAVEEPLPVSLPWLPNYAKSIRELMGDDYWPYGIEKNRGTIDALCQYTWEQGLAARKVGIEELFVQNIANLSQFKL
ncbi:ABC transporter substrate-binding protein [Paraburkholderia xenovorans]